MTDIMARSNQSQVTWLNANGGGPSTLASHLRKQYPDEGSALFNLPNDRPAARNLGVVTSAVGTKGNFTWVGQILGANFKSDGRLQGGENNMTSLVIPQPTLVPSGSLLQVSPPSFQTARPTRTPPATFVTASYAQTTVIINPEVLEISNGHSGEGRVNTWSTTEGGRPGNGATSLKREL